MPQARSVARAGNLILLFLAGLPWHAAGQSEADWPDLATLAQIEVTTAARRATALEDTPAAVAVITGEELLRSGATTLPDALRYVPGVDLAQIQSFTWAASIRGFNGQYSNLLLAMIDGRSIYTPTTGGIFWIRPEVFFEDVDRIEVVRGPGGTLWGANAVNGVINVLTKDTADTLGGVLTAATGTHTDYRVGAREGFRLGEHTCARVYATASRSDGNLTAEGDAFIDSWRHRQAGFRLDHHPIAETHLTLQGDLYDAECHNPFPVPVATPPYLLIEDFNTRYTGANLLTRLEHRSSDTSTLTAQAYWDFTAATESILAERRHTVDLQLQHDLRLGARHTVTSGLSYRYSSDRIGPSAVLTFPGQQAEDTRLYSLFAQDEIALAPDRLFLTLGTKLEHNDRTGWEHQPSLRLRWHPAAKLMVWAAAAEAVAPPNRTSDSGRLNLRYLPPGALGTGSPLTLVQVQGYADRVERLRAYELGVRYTPAANLLIDATAFLNDYSELQSTVTGAPDFSTTPALLPIYWVNRTGGRSHGAECQITWQPRATLRLQGGYSYFASNITSAGIGRTDRTGSPRHKASLRASLDLGARWRLDTGLRYVSRLQQGNIPAYLALDLRLAWRPRENWEIALSGQNLTDSHHPEFPSALLPETLEVPRTLSLQTTWRL